MTYIIETNKTIPLRGKYPFEHMNVGESFSVPLTDRSKVRGAVNSYALRNNKKFITRSLIEDGIWIARIWRIE